MDPSLHAANRTLAAASIPPDNTLYQRQIDALVYELYGLTEDKIRTVEENR